MANDPQSLANNAACLDCNLPVGLQQSIIIYLLNQISGLNMSPQDLATNAACYNCIPPGLQGSVMIWLLTQISAGGGGSGANFLHGVGSPAGAIAATAIGQTYFDTASQNFWMSSAIGTGGWIELIGS